MKRFLLIVILFVQAVLAPAQDLSSQKNRKARLEKEIRQIEQQLKQNEKKSSSALGTLSLVRKKVSNRKALVEESNREIALIEDSMATLKHSIDTLNARLDTLTLYYNKLINNAYRNRDSRVWYMYILSSETPGQALRRYAYLRSLSSRMNAQALKISDARGELEEKMAMMKLLQFNAKSVKDKRTADLNKLQKEEKQSEKLIESLKKDKNRYTRQLQAKKKQVDALNKEIKRLIQSAVASNKKSTKPVDVKLSKEFSSNMGKLPWPADGPVVDHFGQHNHPVYKTLVMPFNNGINISLSPGDKVKCVFDGEVKKIIVMPGYNKCVLVQHGDYFTFYCKLGDVAVKSGDKLTTGQTIGSVATLDGQTQLHFQLWEGNTPSDPENWLR